MRMKINEKDARLEVSLYFSDSRVIDLEIALSLAARPNKWALSQIEKRIDHVKYTVTSPETFLASVEFTYGLEPPTRAVFENKPPETREYLPAYKKSVLWVVKEFLDECSGRGLLPETQKTKAIAELNAHDPELVQTR